MMHQNSGSQTAQNLPELPTTPQNPSRTTSTSLQLTSAPVSQVTGTSNPLVVFSFPTSGAQISTDAPVTIKWSFAGPSLLQKFPDLGLRLIVEDTNGNQVPLNESLLPLSQVSFDWNVAQTVQFVTPMFTPGKHYRIVATLQYSGNAHFTCDPTVKGECAPIYDEPIQSEIVAARQYSSKSGLFNINVSPKTAKLSCTVTSSQSTVAVGQEFLLSWKSTNAQEDDVSGQGINIQGGVTWGDQKITLSTPGKYTYTVTAHGYSTNPGTATCSTVVTVTASGQ